MTPVAVNPSALSGARVDARTHRHTQTEPFQHMLRCHITAPEVTNPVI